MSYQIFAFRAPDVDTFLADVNQVASDHGIDAVERGVLEETESGLEPGYGVDVIPPNRWHIDPPDTDGSGGTVGDYALVNVIIKDADLIALAESFAASDPSKEPAEIPTSEKIGSGTHRIDVGKIKSPVRVFFGGSPDVDPETVNTL